MSIGAVIVALLLVDRIGRNPLLLVGSIGMAAFGTLVIAFLNATTAAAGSLTLEGIYGPLALIAANVYVIFFNGFWRPVMWVMLGATFSNQIPGTGLAVSGLAQWSANFGITLKLPIMLTSIGARGGLRFLHGLRGDLNRIPSEDGARKPWHRTRGHEGLVSHRGRQRSDTVNGYLDIAPANS